MSGLEGNPSATSSAVAGSATGSSVEVCRLFGHRNYRPSFEFTFTLPPKNEKPLTAKNVTPYRITAEEIAPYFGYTASAKVVFAEKQKTAYRHKLAPYCIAGEKIPPHFGFTASAKVVTARNEKTVNRLKITTVWQYRPPRVRLKTRYRRPPWENVTRNITTATRFENTGGKYYLFSVFICAAINN